jgi:hypothetical protein
MGEPYAARRRCITPARAGGGTSALDAEALRRRVPVAPVRNLQRYAAGDRQLLEVTGPLAGSASELRCRIAPIVPIPAGPLPHSGSTKSVCWPPPEAVKDTEHWVFVVALPSFGGRRVTAKRPHFDGSSLTGIGSQSRTAAEAGAGGGGGAGAVECTGTTAGKSCVGTVVAEDVAEETAGGGVEDVDVSECEQELTSAPSRPRHADLCSGPMRSRWYDVAAPSQGSTTTVASSSPSSMVRSSFARDARAVRSSPRHLLQLLDHPEQLAHPAPRSPLADRQAKRSHFLDRGSGVETGKSGHAREG